MATDIKVVKTVFVVDTADVKKATSDYNALAKSIDNTGKELTDTGTKATEGSKKLKDGIDNSKQSVEKLKSSFSGIGSVIAGAFAIGSVIAFGKSVLDATVKNEQLTKSFEVMLKSKVQADILMAQLVQFAKTTPFELTEVAEATKKLLAFGIASSDIKSTLTKLGDVSAGIGAPLSEIAYLFGTIKTQGRAMTQDINQFTNRGIPMWDELAKVTGISGLALKKYVEEGKIGYKEIDQAFTNLTTNGGKFTGLMEAQSKTLGGTISNLGDSWDQFMVKLGNGNSGILKSIVSTLGEVVDKLNEWAETEEDAVKSLAEKKSRAVQKYVEDDYKKFIELGKKNGIDERTAIEERYNNQTQLKSDLLTKQQEKLEELELKRTNHKNRIGDGLLFERLSEIAKLEYGAEQDRLDNLVISQKAEIEKTKLHQKILEDVKKKHFEDITKVEEGETKKQKELRLKEQKQRVEDALNLLKHEESIAKQKAINEGKNAVEIVEIEELYNYKRVEIYNKYSDILNTKQKQDAESTIVNVDTLATKHVEVETKMYADLLAENQKYYKEQKEQTEKNEKDLIESNLRYQSINQSKLSIERSESLKKVLDNDKLTYQEKQKEIEKINIEFEERKTQIEVDGLKKRLNTETLDPENRLAIVAEIKEKELDIIKKGNEKILEDDKATAEKRKEVTKQGLALLEEGINAVYSYKKNVNDQELIDLKDKEERELKLAGDNQAKKEAIALKYQALQAEVRRKQFEQNKQIALINVAINTAEGIQKAVALSPATFGLPFSAFVGASGLIQAGLINSQPTPKFAKGVIDLQGKGTGTSDEIHAMLSKGESVMTAEETSKFKPLLQSIRRKELSPELANMMLNGQKMSNINLNTDSLARELRGMPKNHISIDKDGFKTFLYSENLKQESLNNRYLS